AYFCCSGLSPAGARRLGLAATRCRRRWSSPASSSLSRQRRWRWGCCFGCFRKPGGRPCGRMNSPTPMPGSATAGGFLLVLAVVLPVAGALLALALGGRQAERVALVLMPAGLAVAVGIAATVWSTGNVLQYLVGSWGPPLGVAFRADGLSAVMIVTAALLIYGIGLFARAQFSTPRGGETRAPLV